MDPISFSYLICYRGGFRFKSDEFPTAFLAKEALELHMAEQAICVNPYPIDDVFVVANF